MNSNSNHKDFLSIRDFSPSDIQYLLTLGRQIKAHPAAYRQQIETLDTLSPLEVCLRVR